RWNWRSAQEPVLSHTQELVALTGPRADKEEDYQTRVLHTRTGEEAATIGFDGSPGVLLAIADDRLVYTGVRSSAFATYDFGGDLQWRAHLPEGCTGTAAQITADRLVMLTDCVPAPDRMVVNDHMLAFDLADGELVWDHVIDAGSDVAPESF